MGLPRTGGGHPGRAGRATDLAHPRPRARAESAAALDGRAGDAGERERRVGEGIGDIAIVRLAEHPAAPQQSQDAPQHEPRSSASRMRCRRMLQLCGFPRVRLRQPPGARATDPADLPAHRTAYERCDVTALEQAATVVEFLYYPLERRPARPSGRDRGKPRERPVASTSPRYRRCYLLLLPRPRPRGSIPPASTLQGGDLPRTFASQAPGDRRGVLPGSGSSRPARFLSRH
jgi:hypothetical protein